MKRTMSRLRALFRSRRVEEDLDREVAAHLALLEDAFKARGMTDEDARVAARRSLGGVDQTKERHRDTRSFGWLEDLRRDVPYALRGLRSSPGFTIAALLTLALGIGTTTAVFSIVNSVLLQPLPYANSDRLVQIFENRPARVPGGTIEQSSSMTIPEMQAWAAQASTIEAVAGYTSPPITLMLTPSGTVRLSGSVVTGNLLPLLGARTVLGRTLIPTDGEDAGAVVISAEAWRRYFNADPQILQRTIALKTQGVGTGWLDGRPRQIVGVMDEDFDFPVAQTDFWAAAPWSPPAPQTRFLLGAIALMRGATSIGAATDEANTIGSGLRAPRPGTLPDGTRRFEVHRLKDRIVAPMTPALRVLVAAVLVVLLIVVANVANLLLARATVRQREIAVRLAVGASRGRIVRQVLTESLVLAVIGGILGAAIAVLGVPLIKAMATPFAPGVFRLAFSSNGLIFPRVHELRVDMAVLAFTVGVSALSAVLFGVVPALRLSRTDHLQAMGSRGADGRPGETRLRGALVVGQLVLATGLLVAAGLLITSFVKLARVDPGYDPDRLLTFYLVLPSEYPTARKAAVIEDLMREVRTIPRVDGAVFTYGGPLLGIVDVIGTFVPPGRTPEEMRNHPAAPELRSVSHDFLQTMGVRLVDGRLLNERDGAAAPPVLIINRSMMRLLFDNKSPVGQFVHFDGAMDRAPQQIVGVVEDMRTGRFDNEPVPQMFFDYRQVLAMLAARGRTQAQQEALAFGFLSFMVRTSGDPADIITPVRAAVGRVDPAAGIDAIAPMSALASGSMTRQRFFAVLLGVFAALAAVLGAVGIYGVLAYAVLQRTKEIGIRMALGAQRGQVLRRVLGRGALLAATGIIAGIASAAGLSRYLTGMLYGVTPLDATTYVAVGTLFGIVALLASWLPARRATKVDPMTALRCE